MKRTILGGIVSIGVVTTLFGETFAGNGFQFSLDEEPRGEIDTGDDLLRLLQDIPLAIRFDAYVQAQGGVAASTDLQAP